MRGWRKRHTDALLRADLAATDWVVGKSIDKHFPEWCKFKDKLNEIITVLIPLETRRQNTTPPWLDRKTINACNYKRRLFENYLHLRTHDAFTTYKAAEKNCIRLERNARKRFEKEYADERDKFKCIC